MTIVAFKDGIMAADSASFIGEMRVAAAIPKIIRAESGMLIGCAGSCDIIDTVVPWIAAGMVRADAPKIKIEDNDLDALVACPDGRLFRITEKLLPFAVAEPYAIGCGTASVFARAAMLAGLSADAAVALCIEHCRNVGGQVQVERLTG